MEAICVRNRDYSDLVFIPIFRYVGTRKNGFDRILLAAERLCQTPYHKKAPVGTLGFRYNNAGTPALDSSRICTLYFVSSVKKLLQKVEAGTLKVNRTSDKVLQGCQAYMNYGVWDPQNWSPTNL
ncbi:MAG: hypothetical protein SGARI_001835 [Bacillariaceae sp.]